MGADIIAEIQRGRKVGYSDKLIKKSLEMSGYSSASIKQAFRELEKRKNSNGNGFIVQTKSIKKAEKKIENIASSGKKYPESIQEPLQPPVAQPNLQPKKKHWLKILIEIILGILIFAVVGIMLYLYFLPAVSNTII